MKNSIPQLFIIFFGLLFLSISCNNDEIECTTPPAPIVFEFVDTEGNNLIGNGELNINQIKIKEIISEEQQKTIGFIKSEDNTISLLEVGWFNGSKNYSFESPLIDFGFTVVSSEITGNCSGYSIEEIQFVGVDPERGAYDIYKIVVDPI